MSWLGRIWIMSGTARPVRGEVRDPMLAVGAALRPRPPSLLPGRLCSGQHPRAVQVEVELPAGAAEEITPEEGLGLRRQRCLWTSATWSATGLMTMVPDPRLCLPLQRRSLQVRNQNDLSFSSGTPVKNPACTAHATMPIFQ